LGCNAKLFVTALFDSIFDLSPLVQALSTLEHVANALREEEALKRRCRSLEEELRASQSRVFDLTNSEEELKQRYAALEEELKKGQDEHKKCQTKLQEELKTSQSQVLTHKMFTDQSKRGLNCCYAEFF
jgi:chromosome segregation ATPase